MAKRHFLQQAHKYVPSKHNVIGWYISEKFDGQRALWDGGGTRGLPVSEIPWANTAKDKKEFISTGLWSRYGKPIFAPDWWLDTLPNYPLDGELWCGRGNHQLTRSIVSRQIPDGRWNQVRFMVFDAPDLNIIMQDSIIDIPNYYKELSGVPKWLEEHGYNSNGTNERFCDTYDFLLRDIDYSFNKVVLVVPQEVVERKDDIEFELSEVLSRGGEGIVVRNPNAVYIPERPHHILKLKPYHDAEATVIGYVTGRETALGSRLLGLMGALVVRMPNGKVFELSGFTDEERTLAYIEDGLEIPDAEEKAFNWAWSNPETTCPSWIEAVHFPRGSRVTYKYRELTDSGIPKEAAYLRQRGEFE